MSGDKRRRAIVCEQTCAEGLGVYVLTGLVETHGDKAFVRVGTTLDDGSDWHETEADALRAVAARVAEIGERIAAQAARLAEGKR